MPQPNTLTLAPQPKRLTARQGVFDPSNARYILLDAEHPKEIIPAARQTGLAWELTASPKAPKNQTGLTIRLRDSAETEPEGYKLTIRPEGIEIISVSPVGAFHAASTLLQIIRQSNGPLPCLTITDWPDLPNRGVMLDISRDKVPTMPTLYRLVDLLAEWKLNQFQLYTEHTFAYHAHPTVWKDASPMTGEQIMELDAYCRSKFIELVPNQNSFGHMERWLKHDEYRPMAEHPYGGETAWGYRERPGGLCPTDRRSIPFISGLYDELLLHFTSRRFNVGLDETVDLGYGRSKAICKRLGTGRVYLDFLLKIHDQVTARGFHMMFWGDIIMHYPELIPELPTDITALEWGYENDHPFLANTARFRDSGVPFYVCPGASNWNSISGRTDNTIENIASSATAGLANGAIGMLNTSWGDNGHWDPLPVAYPGFLAGAMLSWNAKSDAKKTLAQALSLHAFNDPTGITGQALYDLGNLYKCFKKRTWNNTVQWQMLFKKPDDPAAIESVALAEVDAFECRLKEITDSLAGAQPGAPDAGVTLAELRFVIDLLRLSATAARTRLGGQIPPDIRAQIELIKEQHREVWLMRNRPGGLQDSEKNFLFG